MTDEQMSRDLKMILSRLLRQITAYEAGTNYLLPTPSRVLPHIESTALCALQDYPCDSITSTQAAGLWYALKSIYGAARGWREGNYHVDVKSLIVIIKCTIQEALEDHSSICLDQRSHDVALCEGTGLCKSAARAVSDGLESSS